MTAHPRPEPSSGPHEERAPNKPRVHWISPLPPARTDIAHYTARILPELAQHCDLVLWTDAQHWDPALEAHCEVRHLDPDRILPADFARAGQKPGGADVLFIHIGNSWSFHSGLLRLARRMPSIIVMHDLAIQEMLSDSILNARFPASLYVAEMARWHGEEGRTLAEGVLDGRLSALEASHCLPGFELTLDKAVAVLGHTRAVYDAALRSSGLPAYLLNLPFRPSRFPPSAKRVQDGPLKLMQFGYIGPNRRLEPVLEALAPLRDDIDWQFDIMGNVWDPGHVMARAEQLGLANRVHIHGFVEESVLDARLAEAHLVFNLRHPTMGEASGSQLRIWNASAAAVVTDLGWYRELPDETVFKIPLEQEKSALQDLLRRLAQNRNLCEQIGAAGRAQLEKHHTPALYAAGIAQIATQIPPHLSTAIKARAARQILNTSAMSQDLLIRTLAAHL